MWGIIWGFINKAQRLLPSPDSIAAPFWCCRPSGPRWLNSNSPPAGTLPPGASLPLSGRLHVFFCSCQQKLARLFLSVCARKNEPDWCESITFLGVSARPALDDYDFFSSRSIVQINRPVSSSSLDKGENDWIRKWSLFTDGASTEARRFITGITQLVWFQGNNSVFIGFFVNIFRSYSNPGVQWSCLLWICIINTTNIKA